MAAKKSRADQKILFLVWGFIVGSGFFTGFMYITVGDYWEIKASVECHQKTEN